MNQKQTDITTGKQIRHLRTQSGMTQEELAGKLNVTRQALSNWERDVNEPDLNTLKKFVFFFGVHMDDFAKEVITKMETCEKKRNDNLISMIWQLDFLWCRDISWHWYFLCWRFYDNVGCRVGSITIWRWLFFSCIWLDMPCSYYIEKK